jgi:hypothetical protein
MKRETQNNSRWNKRATVLLATAAALTALVFTSTVEAGGHRHHRHHKHHKHHEHYKPYKQYKHYDYGHVRRHRGYRALPPAFVAPIRMHHRYGRDYRPFFVGHTYFRPHRHRHAIYVFPVRTRHGIVYREYEYCRGDLFVGQRGSRGHLAYHGNNVSFSIGF